MTLTLKTGTHPFRMTLRVMMIYHHNKVHEERLSGSEDIIKTNYINPEDLNPHRDLDLEVSNPELSHNTLARDDTPQYQIWLQKFQLCWRYGRSSFEHFTMH